MCGRHRRRCTRAWNTWSTPSRITGRWRCTSPRARPTPSRRTRATWATASSTASRKKKSSTPCRQRIWSIPVTISTTSWSRISKRTVTRGWSARKTASRCAFSCRSAARALSASCSRQSSNTYCPPSRRRKPLSMSTWATIRRYGMSCAAISRSLPNSVPPTSTTGRTPTPSRRTRSSAMSRVYTPSGTRTSLKRCTAPTS